MLDLVQYKKKKMRFCFLMIHSSSHLRNLLYRIYSTIKIFFINNLPCIHTDSDFCAESVLKSI